MRIVLLILLLSAFAPAQWNFATSESTASLRGIHNAGGGVIWASGTKGTVLRSEDDGYMWQTCNMPPETAKLDFRAAYGWDANHAAVMSSGTGDASRLYATEDGGATWKLLFHNPDPDGFWDALAFRAKTGVILGDPVNGRFVIYRSVDGGQHWKRDESAGLAADPQKAGAFAASNSSLVILPDSTVLFGTGGLAGPHVYRSNKPGEWTSAPVPMSGGKQTTGIFSVAFRDSSHGVAVGGDYEHPDETSGTAAFTSDGGKTWQAATKFPSGYRSAVAYDSHLHAWIAVGTNGTDLSRDDGHTWKRIGSGNWNALSLPWVAGPKGQIASLDVASPLLK